MTLRLVFAGTPAFAVPALDALVREHSLAGVMTQPDRPAGRGRGLTASPVKQRALELGLPVLQPASLRGADGEAAAARARLATWQPDAMVVVAYGLLLPPEVLALPRLGCLNIHASLLPRWRGAAPIQRAILAGDDTTGVSIMRMDAGLDTGDVMVEEPVPIGPTTTAADLHDTLSALGARLILQALAALESGDARFTPQDGAGATHAAKLAREESVVDWSAPAAVVDRRIRAYAPWPGATARHGEESLKLLRSRLLPAELPARESTALAGTVLGLRDDTVAVACGEGVVGLIEVQRAGRRPVAARDWFNALPRDATVQLA